MHVHNIVLVNEFLCVCGGGLLAIMLLLEILENCMPQSLVLILFLFIFLMLSWAMLTITCKYS